MSALLTDEAVRAASRLPRDHFGGRRAVCRAFLRYHATEGREALVEALVDVLLRITDSDDSYSTAVEFERAEHLVTALVGPVHKESHAMSESTDQRRQLSDRRPSPRSVLSRESGSRGEATTNFLRRVRNIAREHGYAVAVHGSEARDLDLIAIPWAVEAVSAQDLVEALCERVPLLPQPVVPPMASNPEAKPWGRLAWSLAGCPDHKYVDLSVAPRAGEPFPLPNRLYDLDAAVLSKNPDGGEGFYG